MDGFYNNLKSICPDEKEIDMQLVLMGIPERTRLRWKSGTGNPTPWAADLIKRELLRRFPQKKKRTRRRKTDG